MNRRIPRDASRADTKKPELKIKEIFNWQISKGREVLIEIMCRLSKEGSHKINKLEDEKENAFYQKIFKVKTYVLVGCKTKNYQI